MKYITCFLLANIFYFVAFCSFAAANSCDPTQPCKAKADTASKKTAVKISPAPAQVQPANKPTAKKDDKKNSGDYVSPFSWRPTFLY